MLKAGIINLDLISVKNFNKIVSEGKKNVPKFRIPNGNIQI